MCICPVQPGSSLVWEVLDAQGKYVQIVQYNILYIIYYMTCVYNVYMSVCVYMSSCLVWGVLDARGNQVLLSYTLWIARKDCLVWTHDHHRCDDDYDQHHDDDDNGTQGKRRSTLVKELVIIPVKYTPSYNTCSGCDTLHKKYGNLMKHIKRPIFPRHIQSALTLIVVQKT